MHAAKLTKNLVLGSILLILAFSIFVTPNIGISENQNLNTEEVKRSLDASYTPHAPIQIFQHSDFVSLGFPGDGSESTPYRIENLSISIASGYCIEIKNTNAYFIINNCLLEVTTTTYGTHGIYLEYVSNGNISDCIVDSPKVGIYCKDSDSIRLENCSLYDCYSSAIQIWDCEDVTVRGSALGCTNNLGSSLWSHSEYSIRIFDSTRISIANTTRNPSSILGVEIHDSSDVTLTNNTFDHIECEDVESSTFQNNTLSGNIWTSLFLRNSIDLTILNNDFEDGIYIEPHSIGINYWMHTVANNTVNGKEFGYFANESSLEIDGHDYGQVILVNCTDSLIENGTFSDVSVPVCILGCNNSRIEGLEIERSREYPIVISNSNSTTIRKVKISSILNDGILVRFSLDTIIEESEIDDLTNVHGGVCGISLQYSNRSIVHDNIVSNSETGIDVYDCLATIANNSILYGRSNDIYVSTNIPCVIKNNTLENGIGIYDPYIKEISYFDHEFSLNRIGTKQFGYFFQEMDLNVDGSLYAQIMIIDCTNVVVSGINSNGLSNAVTFVYANQCGITDSYIDTYYIGVRIVDSTDCFVADSFVDGYSGLTASGTGLNLTGNTIQGEWIGISGELTNSLIEDCKIQYSYYGFRSSNFIGNIFRSNTILSNNIGLQLMSPSSANQIYYNVFSGNNYFNAQDSGMGNVWDDGIDSGNYWSDYSGSGVYTIEGSTGSVDRYPHTLAEANQVPPVIQDEPDQTIHQGNASAQIRWEVTDSDPDRYEILLNETLEVSDDWDGSDIIFSLSSLDMGKHNVTLIVYDLSGLTDLDLVIVTVLEEIVTTTNTTTTTTTSTNSTTSGDISQFLSTITIAITLGSSLILVSVVILIIRNRKFENI